MLLSITVVFYRLLIGVEKVVDSALFLSVRKGRLVFEPLIGSYNILILDGSNTSTFAGS